MVYVKTRAVKDSESDVKSGDEESGSLPSKRSRRSVKQESPPSVQTPISATGSTKSKSLTRASKEHMPNDTPVPNPETPTKRVLKRSSHLIVSPTPQFQTPTRRSRRRSTDLSENPPQVQTPTRRLRKLSTDLSENPQVQTPTRCSRRLSTDLSENPPRVQTPTRRSRRDSTDLSDVPQVQTPTRRSRRNSAESSDTPTVKPMSQVGLGLQTLTRRSRRLSTDLSDASASQPSTPTTRSRRRSTDLSNAPTEVQTPTTRSRRLSTDDQDQEMLVDKTLAAAKRTLVTLSDNLSTVTPGRRSRRQSGAGLAESANEKPLCMLKEEDEDKDDDKDKMAIPKSKADILEVIEEDEKENEPELKIVTELYGTEKNLESITEESDDDLKIVTEKQPSTEMQKIMNNKKNYSVVELEDVTNEKSKEIAATISPSPKDVSSIRPNEGSRKVTSPSEHKVVSTTASINVEKDHAVSNTTSTSIEEIKENEVNQPAIGTVTNKITNNVNQKSNNLEEAKITHVRGIPVSGRWWKEEKKRFNSINKDQGPKSSWAVKMKRKQALKDVLTMKLSIQEEKKRKKADLRERQRLNTVRRQENAKKSEIVQVIKDSRKIKKMKKKQLRYIETRDTSQMT